MHLFPALQQFSFEYVIYPDKNSSRMQLKTAYFIFSTTGDKGEDLAEELVRYGFINEVHL